MATLYINRNDSRCGACNKNADPHEPAHIMGRMEGVGCGAKFDGVASDYWGTRDAVQALRPDLAWVGIG